MILPFKFTSIALFAFLPNVFLFAQLNELSLPRKLPVTGISFNTHGNGIITTKDTTIYRVVIDQNNNPHITEIALGNLNKVAPIVNYSHPFWLNDTTFGFTRFYWDENRYIGRHHLFLSNNNGNAFQSLYSTSDHYNIKKIVALDDSVIFVGITSDIVNSIELLKFNCSSNDYKVQNAYFSGNIYPAFTAMNNNCVLISSFSDSLFIFDFLHDSLQAIKTNQSIGKDFSLFLELESHGNELLGIRADGVYQSSDKGTIWNHVLSYSNHRNLHKEGMGRWWTMQLHPNENKIWRSVDTGLHWTNIISVDKDFSVFEPVYPNWLWIGSETAKDYILYGQFDNSSILLNSENQKSKTVSQHIYPNPFNLSTSLFYNVPSAGFLEIEIYNIYGQFVKRLISEEHTAGLFEVKWNGESENASQVASGIYIIKTFHNYELVHLNKVLLVK